MKAASPGEPEVVTPALLRGWPLPSPGGSKNEKGRLLVVGGGVETPGAVLLAAEAALRVGAGKVQVATTAATATLLAVALPECLVVGLDTEAGELAAASADRLLELTEQADAVLAGSGIGDPEAARALMEALVPRLDTPLVVDALGTAFVTAHPEGVRHLQGRALLTPNAGELARLLDEDPEGVEDDPLAATRRAAERTGVTVLSGGESSFVAEPLGTAWRLDVGAPGAAVAGSGDVKAGAVAGLLSRGVPPVRAAAWGAYLHGRVGERLTVEVGRTGFLAREVARGLPAAVAEVELGVTPG
ncbi:MAG TPA: NAD(P)H-hydrate dehydratase [Ornithinibacter sp.]|nr:NAD(P)H-hydrate dehydratase [Ornithinibacter sp.]